MRKTWLFLALLTLVLTGCVDYMRQSERMVVAECYGVKLYADELQDILPPDLSRMDSLTQANAYIDSWIHRQILIHQAEINLPAEQLDFSKQLQDYRNSLVIYAYETQMIEQYLDTIVSDEEIEAYYEEHKESFQLRSTMVRVAYVILDENCKQMKEFKKLMSDRDTLDLTQLDALAEQDAVASYLDVDNWVRLDDFLAKVPIEIYNSESFLKKNRFVTFEKDDFTYMVRFEDYLLEKSVSPIEIEKEGIKDILLLKRKKELLSQMSVGLYEKAKKEKVFEIY
ncbi:MAG: peptidyl-prolyl cis-trans isomerase [Bacteroidales bacterium]|nr:peptidyl-prolyl cis-trans isomerase [Bacteroidales bacterium]